MRRDPIFYQMFQRSPELLFDLMGSRPENAGEYRFDAVAVKEPKFEIDGVFLLPIAATVLTIVDQAEAPAAARLLLERTEQAAFTARKKRDIIDIVTSIMVYKFATLSQTEVREMLGLNLTEEPRAIREAKEEGREVEAIALITRLLIRRLQQELSEATRAHLSTLSLPVLEDLSEALLDFSSLSDLEMWLAEHG